MGDIIIKESTFNFYFYTLFGVPYYHAKNISEDDKLMLCAHRAYADLRRTIDYSKSSSWLDANKNTKNAKDFIILKTNFKNEARNCIVKYLKELLFCTSANIFDNLHSNCCNEIISIAKDKPGLIKDGKSFTYGHAQKWVNMTLKYMDITGFWDERLCLLRKYMHLPVDNYILKAASDKGLKLPRINGESGKYSESATEKWSNWNDNDYLSFIRNLKLSEKNLPKWEEDNWIEIAWEQSAMNPKNRR